MSSKLSSGGHLTRFSRGGPRKSGGRLAPVQAAVPSQDARMPHGVQVVHPPEQLHLSAAALEDEIGGELLCRLPRPTDGHLLTWSHQERAFVSDAKAEMLDWASVHVSLESQIQPIRVNIEPDLETVDEASSDGHTSAKVDGIEEADTAQISFSCHASLVMPPPWVDRAAQMLHRRARHQAVQTLESKHVLAEGACTLASTCHRELTQARADRSSTSGSALPQGHLAALLESVRDETEPVMSQQVGSTSDDSWQGTVLERMLMQNNMHETIMDFKYWDDPSDDVRTQEGSLLPLWSFPPASGMQQTVTALAWCPAAVDLFVVGHGSFDSAKPQTGTVAVHSLRAPSRPELIIPLPTCVLCLAFHPIYMDLLAVGCQDGTVHVYCLRECLRSARTEFSQENNNDGIGMRTAPIYATRPGQADHWGALWQISWRPTTDSQLRLVCVYEDGRVTEWTLHRKTMKDRDILTLWAAPVNGQASDTDDDPDCPRGGHTTAGLCMEFHPNQADLFLVGTEDGQVAKCSCVQSRGPLRSVTAHSLPTYAVRWNPYHPRIFLSASADWSLKLWDTNDPEALKSYDLKSPVGDVAWFPGAATIFAALTENGRVYVFDLAQNPWNPLCVQKLANKTKQTKLAFNPKEPLLLVGNDRGTVSCLKLSPNLRKPVNSSARYQLEAGLTTGSPLLVFGSLPSKPPAARTLIGESSQEPSAGPPSAHSSEGASQDTQHLSRELHIKQLEQPLELLKKVRSSMQDKFGIVGNL